MEKRKFIERLSRILGIFTPINPEEVGTALLLTLNVFLLLNAYYILKPVREALILAGAGAEIKSYLSGLQAVILIFFLKAYDTVSSVLPRHKFISSVTMFFISNLFIFYLLSVLQVSLGLIGILFFVWMGIFNLMIVAQFWSFDNDIYRPEEGKRLFPLIAFGASLGAFSGSRVASWMITWAGLYGLMLIASLMLAVFLLINRIVDKREVLKNLAAHMPVDNRYSLIEPEQPLGKKSGFMLVFRERYLLLIALMVLFLNIVNTTGEYILGKVVISAAQVSADVLDKGDFIARFYAEFFFMVNLIAMLIQLFLVSRLFRRFGVALTLIFLPAVSLGGYAFIAAGATIFLVKIVKILENSIDYSLMNTAKHALFLITSRDAKYKAKAVIDTFFWRCGDVVSAIVVFLGSTVFLWGIEEFAVFNIFTVCIWLIISFYIIKLYNKITDADKDVL